MKKLITIMAAIALFAALPVYSQNPFPQSINDSINAFIADIMETKHIPGLSACIVIGDEVIWHENYGYKNLEANVLVDDTTLFSVFSVVGTEDHPEKAEMDLKIYPNPASNDVTIKYSSAEITDIKIYDLTDRIVHNQSLENGYSGEAVINVAGLDAGVYFVTLSANGCIHTKKMVIQ